MGVLGYLNLMCINDMMLQVVVLSHRDPECYHNVESVFKRPQQCLDAYQNVWQQPLSKTNINEVITEYEYDSHMFLENPDKTLELTDINFGKLLK